MPSASVQIAAPARKVWDMISDVTRMGDWSPETVSAQWIGGATGPQVGAKFKGRNKRRLSWSTTCTVTESEPGRVFAFGVGGGDTTWRYEFTDAAGGCHVTESCEIKKEPGAIERLLTKLGTGVSWADRRDDLTRGMEQTLARLKASAETT